MEFSGTPSARPRGALRQEVAAVIGLDVAGPHVVQVWVTLDPDKIRPWNQQPDSPTRP